MRRPRPSSVPPVADSSGFLGRSSSPPLVFDLLRYTPESEKEVFDILNALEDRMQHANSAVVMAAAKIFLLLTLPMVSTHQEVLERVKAPLLTHATSSTPEVRTSRGHACPIATQTACATPHAQPPFAVA